MSVCLSLHRANKIWQSLARFVGFRLLPARESVGTRAASGPVPPNLTFLLLFPPSYHTLSRRVSCQTVSRKPGRLLTYLSYSSVCRLVQPATPPTATRPLGRVLLPPPFPPVQSPP